MNRRELLYSLLGVSCLPAFLEAQNANLAPADSIPDLNVATADAVGSSARKFFNEAEFGVFRRLGDALMPAVDGDPGALQAKAPEFLDFLLAESPVAIQTLYRNGVRELNRLAMQHRKRSFAEIREEDIAVVLAPLSEPWTYAGPKDPYGQFLQASKMAFWQATISSREWAEAKSGGRRSAAGLNTYWLPIE